MPVIFAAQSLDFVADAKPTLWAGKSRLSRSDRFIASHLKILSSVPMVVWFLDRVFISNPEIFSVGGC
jgi:hypothetical protein